MLKSSLKLALRVLARRKVFTGISLVGITLTLVVLMIATAVLDNMLAPRAPLSNLDRMLTVTTLSKTGPEVSMHSNPGRASLDPTIRSLPGAEASAYVSEIETAVVYDGQHRVELPFRRTDADFWRIADFRFLEGGPFNAADDAAGRPVVVITDDVRKKLFDGAPALGRSINIGGDVHRVIGVVPAVPLTQQVAYSTMWAPLGPGTTQAKSEQFGNLIGVVLAKSKSDIPALQREFQTRVSRLPIDDPKLIKEIHSDLDTTFEGLARQLTGNRLGDRAPAALRLILVLLAVLLMSLPALNLVTLNLSRILERAPEVGVRKAFGAPKRMLIGQFVMENVVLTLIGGGAAFVLAFVLLRAFDSFELVPGMHFDLNLRVFGYGILIAAFFGVFSGLYPAWKMSRLNPVNALRGGAL
jgi:putative ABC transport system permease protein